MRSHPSTIDIDNIPYTKAFFMKSPLLAMAAVCAFAHVGYAEELKIEGVGIRRDIPCNGQDVGVYGAENKITLTGECGRITVHGSDHKVSLERGTDLSVSGADNAVTGGTVSSLNVQIAKNTVAVTIQPTEGKGRVDVSGAEQKLNLVLATPAELKVIGADQKVEWSLASGAPEPSISSSGVNNSIQKKK
jgi:Tfp pilus tip-associated adhesin PilY1